MRTRLGGSAVAMALAIGVVSACGKSGSTGSSGDDASTAVALVPLARDAGTTIADAAELVATDAAELGEPPLREAVLGDLTPWPGNDDNASGIVIHAADVNAQAIGLLLSDLSKPLYAVTSSPTVVSGRLNASTRKAALAAVAAPPLKVAPMQWLNPRGRGKRVDLYFVGAPVNALMGLIAEIDERGIVAPPSKAQITLHGTTPSDTVVPAIIQALDLTPHRFGTTTILSPDKARPRSFSDVRGKAVSLDVKGASAAQALALLGAVSKVSIAVPCDAGQPFALRLREVPPATVLSAIEVASGLDLRKTGAGSLDACRISESAALSPDDMRDVQLMGIATVGRDSVALFQTPSGLLIVRDGSKLGEGIVVKDIDSYSVRLELPRYTMEIPIMAEYQPTFSHEPDDDDPCNLQGEGKDAKARQAAIRTCYRERQERLHLRPGRPDRRTGLEDARLQLTVVDANGENTALVEPMYEHPFILREGDGFVDGGRVHIEPGRLLVEDAGNTLFELKLAFAPESPEDDAGAGEVRD